MSSENSQSSFDLTGRSAIVTGAGRGIGRAIALALAQAGADVLLASRSTEELEAVVREIEPLGHRAIAHPTDVADLDALSGLFDASDDSFGRLDVLVNCAGVGFRKPALEVTPDEWDQVQAVNIRSVFFACQHALRRMTRVGFGRVINIASLTSFLGFKHVSVYGASKGAVAQLTKALAVEFAEGDITVNAIAPGYIYTQLTKPRFDDPETRDWIMSRIPAGRHGEPADIAGTAVFLASPAAAYVTGVVVPVDGGWLAA